MKIKVLSDISYGTTKDDIKLYVPGDEMDVDTKTARRLILVGSAATPSNFDRAVAARNKIFEASQPDLVVKSEPVAEYDPEAEAAKIGDEKAPKEKTSKEVKEPATKEPEGKKPLPNMSKAELTEIAEARGLTVDEVLSRDEVYKLLKENDASNA